MVKVCLIGAGKMGISHLAILGAHPEVEIVGVCDSSKIVTDVLKQYSGFQCFSDYNRMIESTNPDAVFIAVPTKYHATIAGDIVKKKIHVFMEKPFCLNSNEGLSLVADVEKFNLVNQVGYHNKFVGTFNEVKRIINSGMLGDIYHFTAEAYGPVVVRKRQETWRSNSSEGGGCLMDYASHVIDLINYLISPVKSVQSSLMKSIYSEAVEDSVYSLLNLENGVSGVLSVNWSDDTYRKMSTSITIIGKKGKIISDANELKVYFKSEDCPEGYSKGWTIKYVTELTEEVDFYLRGEEYSLQVDHFIKSVQRKVLNNKNTFHSAWLTDKAIDLIKNSVN